MVIYQGIIANHDTGAFLGQINIDDNSKLIKSIDFVNKDSPKADHIFDENCIIFPGMGDIHIHAREDDTGQQMYKEDYTTAGNAAINGGVVFTAAMPNTPNPLTTLNHFKWHRNRIKKIDHKAAILNYVGIGKGTKPIGLPGEHPYKAFFGKSVGSLTFYDEHELEAALKHYGPMHKEKGGHVGHNISFHVEYEPFIDASKDGKTHSERRPIGAVNHGLKLLLPLIEKHGIQAKLCHWSTGGSSIEMIEEYREQAEQLGLPRTTVEVSPMHLMFDTTYTDVNPSQWTKLQMNPAIQGPKHRKALIEGLRNGTIDYLATDHAPHTMDEKFAAFAKFANDYPGKTNQQIAQQIAWKNSNLYNATCCENNTSGAPWLDTYATVVGYLLREHKFTTQDIARVTAYNPGLFVNQFLQNQFPDQDFGKGFGKIAEGYIGSLTVINTKKHVQTNSKDLKTKVGWSPLEGRVFIGGLEAVVVRGKKIETSEI